MIDDGDLDPGQPGDVLIMMSISSAKHAVPLLLQTIYQSDACHLNFGKYTLYTCYGIISNNDTFPFAMAVLFGNEDKAERIKFWRFALQNHTCLNLLEITINQS